MKFAKKSIFSQLTHQETSVFLAGWCKSFPGKPAEVFGVKKNGERGVRDDTEGIEGIEGFMDHSAPDFVGGGTNCPRYGEDLATAVDLELKLTP